MSKFIEDRSYLKKKKKKETTTKKAAPSSPNKKQVANIANQVVNKTATTAKRATGTVSTSVQRQQTARRNVQRAVEENAPHRYNNRPSGAAQPSTNHTVQDRLAASRQRREQAEADIRRRRQENEARSQRISQSRNPRMQDTARGTKLPTLEERRQRQDRLREAQRQKMGYNSMASEEAQKTANRALKNTPTVVKESAKQVGIGHGKTLADITEANKSAAIGSKIDIKSKEFQEDIEKRRKESTRVAGSSFKTLSDMQEKSEQKMQKVTKDAKGLEKAYYGALESGTGMATDRLAGPAWAVSMLSRTYGNTRGQAKKEGATENEDRAYSLLQAAKEVATEYMFQGVGLAKGLSGSKSLALGEKAANALTKNMRGPLANATHAGIRLLGGVGEENLEEVAGWGLDPFIKEFTYGKNVRTRKAQQMLREQSDSLRSNITSIDDARAMAAYLSSEDFLEQQVRTYMDSGIGEKEARDLAENMRDYLDASLSGDTEKMADIEESMSKKLSGRNLIDIAKQDLSLSELKDTIESTTLLTATTGLPGTVTTAARGAAVKEQLGSDGIRALAKTAEDFEDGEMQLKAKAMSDRLDAGKDITNTQAYDLAVGVQEQYNKDADRQQTAYQTAQKTIKSEKLVTPYRVSRDGDIQMDEVTDKAYQSTAKSAKSAIETFIENSDGKESLTDTEIDRGSRAIAGFKTGVFTVDDANELNYRNTAVRSAFEAETGVDLSEYVVKGKNGQIDIPATNTATKNALFAMAADNLVQTAQAETANWVDNTKGEVVSQISRRMGASGTAALQTALDDVDERDRSSYMMTANASDVLYQSARNMGTEWENAKDYAKRMFPDVAEDKLKAMYEAGLADRDMATDEARGQQIKIGEKIELKKQSDVPTGQVIIETSAPVKGSVIRTFTELARNLGVDIHLVDHFTDKDGKVLKNVNGEYIDGNIFINVNSDFEKNMGFIFMHEVTHHLKMYAPEQYKALENLVREKWFKYDSAQMQSEIAKKIETYAKHGQKLTEEQALEEIIADAAHEFLTDRNFAREIANEDASLAQAILTSIRNALRMLRRIMSADGLDETHMNTLFSQLDILDEAERLWLDAYKQAVRNNAAVEVDRLQNQIYEEGRQSISDSEGKASKPSRKMSDRWENDEKLTHNQFNSWYSAHKLSYGRVARENLDEAIENIKNDGFISTTAISNVVPASINDYTDPNKPNDTQARYGAKEGDVVMFVPRPYVDLKSDIVKNGFKPRDYEIVTVERDYQPYYELYEKAYDQYQENKGRYSIADMPSIDELDMTNSTVEDENGDMVAEFQDNGSVRFSISSFEKSGRAIYQDYLNKQVKNGNLSRKEADDMMHELETVYGIAKEFADKTDENGDPIYAPFSAWSYADVVTDEKGKPVFSAIKKNSEYKMNIDFSTICKKRRTLDAVFREMINRGMFEKLDLNKDESAAMVVNINNLIRQHKFEAACALCFVEARRYRQQQTATTFRDMWNSIVESMYTGNNKAEYFNFGEDSTVEAVPNAIHTLDDSELDLTYVKKLANEKDDKGKLKQTAEAKAARLMLKDPSQRKLMRVGDMMASTGFENMQIKNPELMKVYNSKKGTGGAKSSFGDVQYLNEILKPRSFSRKSAYAVSGVRIQSFSDYVPRMVFDYVQVIADLAAKHLPAHGYTKEPLFVKQFGLTGAKINMSLVPDVAADSDIPGLDKDGNYIWNEEGTFPYDEAMAIQEAEGYKENCGTIAVGISDEHIMKMLADPTIQMVIPYHKSSLNPIVAAMTNVDRFENYEKVQTTKDENGNTVSKDFDWDNKLFRLSHDSKGKMLPKEQWGSVQDLVKEYADWCKSKNYTPKFPQFLYMEDGSINPGYYKLLEDFALLDNDGNFKPQGDVQMRFPTEDSAFGSMKDLIAQGLSEDTELEAKRSSEISGIVDEIEGMFDQGTLTEQSATSEKLAARLSISADLDEPYMAAVNAGNMEEAQRYVDEAAKRAGYTYHGYHGTAADFNVFETERSGQNWSGDSRLGPGIYFAHTEESADKWSPGTRMINAYLSMKKPLDLREKTPDDLLPKVEEYYKKKLDDYEDWYPISRESYQKNLERLKGFDIDDPLSFLSHFKYDPDTEKMTDGMREVISELGYDGFISKDEMVVFNSSQVKSADTVTYAEDGSVIPLSERFDPTNNDIRYSMSTEDADGNVLTTNQMEYFKNSQARDENGRLVPVYHTTNRGGFTVFDPEYSQDHRSLFFASNWDVSQTYGRRADQPIDINKEPRKFNSFEEFEEAWGGYFKGIVDHFMIDIMRGSETDAEFAHEFGRNQYERVARFIDYSEGNLKDDMLDGIPYTVQTTEGNFDTYEAFLNFLGSQIPDTQRGYYTCYLNLENPMIVDARGSRWNNIPYGSDEGLTIDEAISQIEENQAADYGITGIDVYFDYDDEGFPTAVHTRIGYIGVPDEMSWGWDRYEEEDSWTPTIEKDAIDAASVEEQMWEWAEKKLNELAYFDEGEFVNDLETNHIDNNGEIHYTPDNAFGIDFISFGKRADVSTYENMLSDKAANGERRYKTRELAEIAESEGYDGVIIRNCMDLGGDIKHGANPYSDIYIAFSSNQVKDTRNTDPTENPDIRYSFTEDEIKSGVDYDHATDMSYEELLMYEDMIAKASESYDIESAFGKAFDGEKVSKFYSALTEEVGMVFDDEYLEEGRMRMAKSKADFWSNLNTKWQERWETKGEVLDAKSVKTNVRNLIRGVMNNSATDRQYKTELLHKTLMDMRVAYQLMKQDRTDIASALLYHSALRMISDVEFIRDDTEYQEYKGIRDYMRGEPITVGEDYWQGKAFQQFRKEHYGMLKLRKGTSSNIDKVYGQLEELYPHIFNETEREKHGFGDSEEDLLQYIGFVTEQNMQPFTEAYSSEECAEWAFEIADDLYEIMENGEGVTSLADRYKAKYDAKAKAMKTRHAEAILRVRKQKDAAIDALKEHYNERLDQQKEHYNEKLDQQKEQYSERLNSQKVRARDAIRRERERFRQQKQDEKERTKERRLHSKYFDSIVKSHKKLSDRLLTNTKDKHIPEQYKKDLAELLAAFDLQTVASKKLEIRNGLYYRQNYQSQKTIRMKALQETLLNIQADSQLFYVNDSITEIIDRLLGKNAEGKTDPLKSVEGRTIDELTASELKDIDNLLKALIHEFNNYESVRVGAKRQQAADIGTAQIDSCLDHAGKFGEGLDYQNFLGALDNILNLDEVTPAYMFRQIDPQNNGIGMMFKELRRSFGKYVRNQNQLNEWMDEIIGEYNNKGRLWNKYGSALEEWRVSTRAKEFQLTNGNVKLTPAQMMSIYCLSHRQQAYDHMTGAGIVVQPVSFQARMASDLKKRANYALPVILTDADIKLITSKLTPDQIKVADKLQELMATKMAEWGNEASMSVMGIRLFEDPDYFPIKSDKAALEKDFSAEQFMDCIRNFGFTKAVQPGARNAIAIGDIFDVVAEHCNNMNLYNAYSESMNDFMKVYNYHAMREDGSDYSVEQAIAHAYSKKATTFIRSFMKDLNGNVSKERTTGIEQMMNDSLGKAKKASVFANGRVALQQPTALMRAFAVINPKYLKGVKAGKATMQEMFEHSPIALWKSWGYYDINMGKSIEDLMMNNGSWAEDKMSDIYGELDNRTWAVIWTMCKNEVEDKHKDVEKGSDEYWELVSERFDEVVDLTQVVDSPFHRSHAMRSKNTLTKMATAFMAEPTLTYNMVRDGMRRAKEELRLGNKKAAGKIAGRTVAVFALSAWATAAAAAIWDAVRGKAPGGDDDDEEQGFFDMWFDNMIENLKDNLNLLNNIYYVKDVVSLLQGWDQRNLGLQGWKHFADAFRQLKGEKVYSKLSWYENILAGVGYLTGRPYKTMMTDGKAVFKMFGLTTPAPIQEQLDKLDSIGSSTKDMNSGKASSSGVSSSKKTSETRDGESKSTSVNLWTYDNAPFHIEDGSLADKFLNHFGINLTSAEIAAIENAEAEKKREAKIADIKERTADLTGEAKTKKVWSMVTSYAKEENNGKSMSEFIHDGDYNTINRIKEMYIKAGGDPDYFKERVFATSKTELKKTISANNTEAQIEAQQHIKDYLLQSGMSEAELSDIAYRSYTKKDLQVAIRIGDADAAVTELRALLEAGLSDEDFYKIWDNRNRINLVKYRENGGKYAERLKSMGTYNWPCNGTITSNFGHRHSPGNGVGSTDHKGIDIGASMGAPVTAADGGVVVRSGWYGGYGKTVQIQHDDGTITQYSHLSWWEPKVGDVVAQGQEIGKVGSTGNSTGPHLHFGVMKNGEYVDPMDYLNKKS